SLSPDLQQIVGTKTLGADKLATSRITDAQKQDNKNVAKGWKIQHLNQTVESILASATRLEKEIEHETKYWEQVLAVSEKGWAICRLPNQKHILGVRFGFSEASPAFKSRSLAALQRNANGTISLGQGLADAEPRTLRVRIQAEGEYTGSSSIPKAVPQDAPIESLILQARNTIFSEELWQELNRESRTLEPVQARNNTLIFQLSATKTMVLDLIPLEEQRIAHSGVDGPLAESLFLALSLLLSYAHRKALERRSQLPPPISSEKRPNPSLSLFRLLIARARHQEIISQLHALFRPLLDVLRVISLAHPPTYTLVPKVWPVPPNSRLSVAERTILALTTRLEVIVTFTITPSTTLTIHARTHCQPALHTQFTLSLSPSSPLHAIFPPVQRIELFPVLREYIYHATTSALASLFLSPSPSIITSTWKQTAHSNILHCPVPCASNRNPTAGCTTASQTKQLSLTLRQEPLDANGNGHSITVLRAQWEWARGEQTGAPAMAWTDKSFASAYTRPNPDTFQEEEGRSGKGKRRPTVIQGENFYEWIVPYPCEGLTWEEGEGIMVWTLEQVMLAAGR
ncbi:RNA polymerase II mediator complex component SRB4, partial [Diplocarpon rosae]